jgi:hypothetical protein
MQICTHRRLRSLDFSANLDEMPVAPRKPQLIRKKRASKAAFGKFRQPTPKSAQAVALRKPDLGAGTTPQFDVVAFCKRYSLKRDLVSRMTSYAPRTVADWAAGKPLRGAAVQKITELKRLTNALEQLVEPGFIGPWFQMPNASFEGSTPAQLVERGESDRLWRMIHLLESGQPG